MSGRILSVLSGNSGTEKAGIKVVAACSERKTEEKKIGNDTGKVSYFIFVQFREY